MTMEQDFDAKRQAARAALPPGARFASLLGGVKVLGSSTRLTAHQAAEVSASPSNASTSSPAPETVAPIAAATLPKKPESLIRN